MKENISTDKLEDVAQITLLQKPEKIYPNLSVEPYRGFAESLKDGPPKKPTEFIERLWLSRLILPLYFGNLQKRIIKKLKNN